MIYLTKDELSDITSSIRGDIFYSAIEILENSIPILPGEDLSDYIEDDGRQYRFFRAKYLPTNEILEFSYTWHQEWESEYPHDFYNLPNNLQIVEKSILDTQKIISEPIKEKTPEEIKDAELIAEYRKLKDSEKLKEFVPGMVPPKTIKDIREFLKTKKFSMYDLRAKIFPICIEYLIEEKSFWQYVQRIDRKWK